MFRYDPIRRKFSEVLIASFLYSVCQVVIVIIKFIQVVNILHTSGLFKINTLRKTNFITCNEIHIIHLSFRVNFFWGGSVNKMIGKTLIRATVT